MVALLLYLYNPWTYTTTMKRAAFATVLALLLAMGLFAQSESADDNGMLLQADIERLLAVIDADASLAQLAQAVQDDAAMARLADRLVLIDGTVASTIVFDDDPANFYAEIELIGGTWEGLQSVRVDRAYAVLMGPDFAQRVPAQPPRQRESHHIVRNSRVMVLGRVIDRTPDDRGTMVPLLIAYHVRPLN